MTGVSERLQASIISWPQSKRQKKKQLHDTATSAEARQIVTTIDAAIRQLDVRLHDAGLMPSDVPRDGSCYFHVVKFWLVHFLGAPAAMRLLAFNVARSPAHHPHILVILVCMWIVLPAPADAYR